MTPKKLAASLSKMPRPAKKPRPYWHVDAKWMLSLVLCVLLGAWLTLLVAHRITSREIGVQLMTNIVTLGIVEHGEVDPEAATELRRKIAESPTKSIQPIPNFPVTITEQDLNLPPKELVDKIFRQITEPLYDKGARAFAEEQTSDKAQQERFVKDASFISIISKEGHDRIGRWVLWFGLLVLGVAAGAIWFSHGFGRLVTPGIVLLLISLPGIIMFSGLTAWVSQPTVSTKEAQDVSELVLSARSAFEPVALAGKQVYLKAFLVGIGLLLAALIGKIVWKIIEHRRRAPVAAKTTEDV